MIWLSVKRDFFMVSPRDRVTRKFHLWLLLTCGGTSIVHNDRGSQYGSKEHRSLMKNCGLVPSMSAKGNFHENATMESRNHSLKVEAIHCALHHMRASQSQGV
jgi:transposase InsO family protein